MANKRVSVYAGDSFQRLTVIEESTKRVNGEYVWRCRCACGTDTLATSGELVRGHKRSCGCLQRDEVRRIGLSRVTHGRGRHKAGVKRDRTYISWAAMMGRCHNPNDPSFNDYGARGISVTKPWRDDFSSFLNDMGDRPLGTSIDRIDGRFGYYAANCRWATPLVQAQNRRKPSRLKFPTALLEQVRRQLERERC